LGEADHGESFRGDIGLEQARGPERPVHPHLSRV
jgi:hypothetical protein